LLLGVSARSDGAATASLGDDIRRSGAESRPNRVIPRWPLISSTIVGNCGMSVFRTSSGDYFKGLIGAASLIGGDGSICVGAAPRLTVKAG
jgi:hypothetical protein